MQFIVSPQTGLKACRLFALLTFLPLTVQHTLAQGVQIGNKAQVVVSGEPQIVIENGHFINDGQFAPGAGTVLLNGTGTTTVSIGGSGPTTFYNLEIARPQAGIQLYADVAVTHEVSMMGGLLELNQQLLDLGHSGVILHETAQNRITGLQGGSVKRQLQLQAPQLSNPGNLGLVVTSDVNLGWTTVIRQHQPVSNEDHSGSSIARSYQIIPENNESLNATLRFQYFTPELNGLPEGELLQWSSNDGAHWQNDERDSFCSVAKWVEKSGYSSFQKIYTLASKSSQPLPLQLLWFTAENKNNQVSLDWELVNNNLSVGRIEIERSATAATGSFQTKGTVSQPQNQQLKFHFTDEQPLPGASFYRLKLIGADGSVVYSPTRRVLTKQQEQVQVYPMPVSDRLQVALRATDAVSLELTFYNTSGQKVQQEKVNLQSGANTLMLFLGQLPQGVYFLKFSLPDYADVKIIKK